MLLRSLQIPLLVVTVGLLLPASLLQANDRENAVSFGGTKREVQYVSPMDSLLKKINASIVWKLEPGQPLTRLVVSLGDCTLYGYQGDKLVASTLVSTGREGYDTKPGNYTVIAKDKDHKSNLYGSFCDSEGHIVNNSAQSDQSAPSGLHYEAAPMPNYLRLTDAGLGLHAGFVTGYPVSHGCIRLPPTFAENLFQVVSVGTPVQITP